MFKIQFNTILHLALSGLLAFWPEPDSLYHLDLSAVVVAYHSFDVIYFSLFTIAFYFLVYMYKCRYLSHFYSPRFPPNFGGNLSVGAARKATSSLATVLKKSVCVRSFGLDEPGALTWRERGTAADFGPNLRQYPRLPTERKSRHVIRSFWTACLFILYSLFVRGRASSSRTRRSTCFSMAVSRSSGRLMDECRVKRKPIRRRSWLRCFVPMTSRQIAS